MKPKVLIVVGQLRAGGLERQLCYLLESVDREACDWTLVVWSHHENDFHVPRIRKLGISLHFFDPDWPAWSKLRRLRRLVKELQPDVVHSYSFYTNFAVWFGAWGTTTLPVGSLRSDFSAEKLAAGHVLGPLSAMLPRCVISNSRAAATNASRAWFVKPGRILVVRNGLNMESFGQKTNIRPTQPVILGVGSLVPHKRWDRLITATAECRSPGQPILLRLIGDGPEKPRLRELAESLGMAGRVEFLGTRDDVPQLLGNCTMLCHTSDSEGCPNVVMEAMAAAKPVVAMDAGDISDLVEHGLSGYVVHRGDRASLANYISKLIADPVLCHQMGERARARAEELFSLRRLATETLAAYRIFRDQKSGGATSEFSQSELIGAGAVARRPNSR